MGEERKKAYEILGIKEGSDKAEVEKRFSILLKKSKMKSASDDNSSLSIDIDEITRAYNLLMGYREEGDDEESCQSSKNTISDFLYYYKLHIIVGVIAAVMLIILVREFLIREPIDLNIAFIGDFYYSETETFEHNIRSSMPELRGISVDGAIISGKAGGQQEYAMQMKATAIFAAGEIDIFILDEASFKQYAYQGAFIDMEGILDGLQFENISKYVLKAEGEDKEAVYGIDVSRSKLFEGWAIEGEEKKIAAVGRKAKNYENIVKFIELLVQY
jgi:hypothetical protein